jgi:hypothetical protein
MNTEWETGTQAYRRMIMPVWEYKTVRREEENALTEEELNALGGAGLELVSVAVTQRDVTIVGRTEKVSRLHYFFRRVKPAAAKPPGVPGS